jgi:type II secretory pathway component GspD/PulD (secretin)
MNKKLYKYITISTIASILLSACSIQPIKEQKKLSNLNKISKLIKKDNKPIKEIYISSYTIKKTNINHSINNSSKKLHYSLKKSKTLGDLTLIDNNEIIISPLIKNRTLPNIDLVGTKIEILNKIAYFTNTYWTCEYNIIKFTKTAEIIYTFPALSLEKIDQVYNVGEKEMANPISAKDSLFNDITLVTKSLVESNTLTAEISYSTENSYINNNSYKESKLRNNENKKENSKEILNQKEKNSLKENAFANKDSLKSVNNINLEEDSESKSRSKNKKPKRSRSKTKPNLLKNDTNSNSLNKDSNKNLNKNSNKNENKNSSVFVNNIANQKQIDNSEANKNQGKLLVSEKYTSSQNRIVISQNSGTVIATITPNEEKILDTVLNSIMKKRFGTMVKLKTYALLVNSSKMKDFNMEFSGLISKTTGSTASFGSAGFSFNIPSASTIISDINVFDSIVSYLTEDNKGKVLLNPTLISLPSVISRIQDTSNIPYLEPSKLTDTEDSTLSYNISYVKEGINMAAISNVFDNNIIMALKFNITQYLGDKTINAGVLGTFELPLSAQKIIQTTYRVSPGDIIVLGGVKQTKYSLKNINSFNIPTGLDNKKEDKEFIFLVQPTLIKFIVKKDMEIIKNVNDLTEEGQNLFLNKTNPKKDMEIIETENVSDLTEEEQNSIQNKTKLKKEDKYKTNIKGLDFKIEEVKKNKEFNNSLKDSYLKK